MKKLMIRPFMIFNAEYDNKSMNREGVLNTKNLMENTFFAKDKLGFDKEKSIILSNETRANVLKTFRKYMESISSETEMLLFYYGGHGCPDWDENKLYLAMYDTDFDHARDNAIAAEMICSIIKEYQISYYAIILDCCYAGLNYSMGNKGDYRISLDDYNDLKGVIFIPTAEKNKRFKTEKIDGKHYLPFSYYFFETLKNGIDNELKWISFQEIYGEVKKKLKNHNIEIPSVEQKGELFNVALWENIKYRDMNEENNEEYEKGKLKVLLVKGMIDHPIKHEDFGVPLGLWLLKGYIEQYCMDIEIEIYDERLELIKCHEDSLLREKTKEKFSRIIDKYDVIGISMSSSEVLPAIKKFKIAKEKRKITFAGGIFTASNEKYLLETGFIDYVTPGIGTTSLRKLLEWLLRQKKGNKLYKVRDGNLCSGAEAKVERNNEIPGVATIENLNDFFIPSYDLLPDMPLGMWKEIVEKYKEYLYVDNEFRMDIHSARGCKGACTFCSVQQECGRQIKYRDINSVAGDIKYLFGKGFTYFSLKDEDCFTEESRFYDLVAQTNLQGKIKFKIRTRIDHLIDKKDVLYKLKEKGVVEIQYGIESSDYMLLRGINKGIKRRQIEKIKNFINSHADLGITANCSFILGLSGETEEYYDELLQFIKDIYDYHEINKPKIYINFLTPHPRNSTFPINDKYSMVTNDLNYFTHKYPIGFYEHDLSTRQKMIDTYEAIIQHTNTEKFNPCLCRMEEEYEYLEAFIVGNKYVMQKPELPTINKEDV